MKKDFKQELTELINKHGLEKEMRDTPDFILAQVCIDAMAVFSDAIARRDEWRGFRKADEKSSQDAKHNYPDDCNICKDRFKCADFMRTQPIANLIQRFKTTTDKEEKTAIAGLLKQINADASGKPQNDIPEEVKEVAGKLAKAFGARVEIHRIEIPERNVSLERNQERSKAMKPVEFPGVNVVFAKDQPEYMPLPAMKIPNDPQGLIITKWQLSPEELERIKETGTIHLSMLTFNQSLQPVLLTVDFPSEQKET